MDDSDLLGFTPVPLRGRRDGWTAKRQYFFILGLARGFSAAKAAALLGMTRKTAYELRSRPGAEGFAAAWAAAVARARRRRHEAKPPSLAERALHGEWHPQLRQGRLVGWVHRPAGMRLMGVLKRLDKRITPTADAAHFDAYVDSLPAERDTAGENPRSERRHCHVPPHRPGLGKA